jgi:hypothetical protein
MNLLLNLFDLGHHLNLVRSSYIKPLFKKSCSREKERHKSHEESESENLSYVAHNSQN